MVNKFYTKKKIKFIRSKKSKQDVFIKQCSDCIKVQILIITLYSFKIVILYFSVCLNLIDFTKKAYGTNYVECLRVQIHANCRIRRIYFSDKLYQEKDLPKEFRLFVPVSLLMLLLTHPPYLRTKIISRPTFDYHQLTYQQSKCKTRMYFDLPLSP